MPTETKSEETTLMPIDYLSQIKYFVFRKEYQ